MQELIKINQEGLVSARELHEFLEVKSKYADWIKNRIKKYEFVENVDYTTVSKILENGGKENDHAITTEIAKELSMVENNDKGSEARKYFIKCEKALKENIQTFNTSQLSPELQMFNQMFKAIANQELANKQLKQDIQDTKQEIQGIRDVVAINSDDWKTDCKKLITKIAYQLGGIGHINDVYKEVYSALDRRLGTKLQIRLTNKRRRMADEGVCKSKRDSLNNISVIAEDKKLIEGYISIVKELAIKYGADMKGDN